MRTHADHLLCYLRLQCSLGFFKAHACKRNYTQVRHADFAVAIKLQRQLAIHATDQAHTQ